MAVKGIVTTVLSVETPVVSRLLEPLEHDGVILSGHNAILRVYAWFG